jgi:iron-sulfur cluster assembly accessory protein
MKSVLNITQKAGKQLIRIAEQHKTKSLLFYVKGGGCNGFNYKIKPLYQEPEKNDEIVKYENINVVVCNKSLFHLLGTTVDWNDDIMGANFKFENPNASSNCGCGTSFSI